MQFNAGIKRLFLLGVIFQALFLFSASQLRAVEIPEELMVHLRKWDKQLDPVTVEWIRSRKSSFSIDELLKKLGYTFPDKAFLDPQKISCGFQNGKIYSRIEENRSSSGENGEYYGSEKDVLNFAFDGEKFYNWSGEVRDIKNTVLFINTRKTIIQNRSSQSPIFRTDTYFPYIGIKFPNSAGDLKTSTGSIIPALLKNSELKECNEEDGLWKIVLEEDLPDQNMILLHTYFLNPEWDYLAKRYTVQYLFKEKIRGVIARREVESFDYKPVLEASYSLPYKVTSKIFNHDNENLYSEEYHVTSAQAKKIPDAKFVLSESRSGATIADYTLPEAGNLASGRVEYVIPENKEDLQKVIAAAKKGLDFYQIPVKASEKIAKSSSHLFLVTVSISAIVLFLFGVLFLRKKKSN